MRSNKRVVSALLLAILSIGVISFNASAATSVTKASKVSVSTTNTTAKVSWALFAKGKVTSIKVTATAGSSKLTKTLTAKATSYTFTKLKSRTTYTFSVYGLVGTKSSAATSVKGSTKKILNYNSIFFGQPEDMLVGDDDQQLFALAGGGTTAFDTTTPTICVITNDGLLKALAMGACEVVASNPGDSSYASAADESRTITVSVPIGTLEKTLQWSDEFNGALGSGPSSSNWSVDSGDGCGSNAGCGFGNNESQAYAACAIKQSGDGILTITSSTVAGDANCKSNKAWTSGKFTSFGKKSFGYGFFEARLKMPAGGGTWPAFWTLGTNINSVPWPNCGELDIMEYAGNSPYRSTSATHYGNSSGAHEYKSGSKTLSTLLSDDFHTYGMLWLPTEVTFYVDNKPTFTVKKSQTGLSTWPFGPSTQGVQPKMYLILNLAMGGNYGGTIAKNFNKATFDIDYVRYYSVNNYGGPPTN
jgi:beta-glucanase (GH16 family)